MRPKTCPSCRTKFTPVISPLQVVCSPSCAIKHAEALRSKRERKETRERKQATKTRQQWLKECQAVFNKWVRLRDADRPCISCGTTEAKWDAGHYRSVGSNPALRFEPLNNHKQCAQCNQHKSGNAIEYRIGLVARIGLAAVEWLEGPHEPKKYTIDDLKQIKAHYTALCKQFTHDGTEASGLRISLAQASRHPIEREMPRQGGEGKLK